MENFFSAAIFDLDGTLLDSMWVWDKVDRDFLRARGFDVPDDYARKIAAMTFRETAEYTIERFGMNESADDLMAEWRRMAEREYETNVGLKTFAREYLEALGKSGVRTAVATSLHRELAERVLQKNEIFEMFDAMCFTDEVGKGKDSPDIFLLAARHLSIEPRDCVVFEDILPAVMSAREAGMRVCCVEDACSKNDREQLKRLADWYISDFREAPLPE